MAQSKNPETSRPRYRAEFSSIWVPSDRNNSFQQLQDVFDCDICGHLLQTPIMLVEHIGNVCGSCCQKCQLDGLPNSALDMIIESLSFFCKYKSNGCTSRQSYKDLTEHQTKCKFRSIHCLKAECEWEGAIQAISTHFSSAHEECIIASDHQDQFTFDLQLSFDFYCQLENIDVKLMKKDDEIYLFLVSMTEENSLSYSMYKDDSRESRNTHNQQPVANVTHLGSSGEYTIHCNVISCSRANFTNVTEGVKVSRILLQELSRNQDTIEIVVQLGSNQKRNSSSNQELLEHLTCTVCLETLKSPIFVGNVCGHSICGCCRLQLNQCAICRATNTWIRNYALESISEQLSCQDNSRTASTATTRMTTTRAPRPRIRKQVRFALGGFANNA